MKLKDILKEIQKNIPYLCKVEYPENDSYSGHAFDMAVEFLINDKDGEKSEEEIWNTDVDEEDLASNVLQPFGSLVLDDGKAQKVIEKFAEYLWEEYFEEYVDLFLDSQGTDVDAPPGHSINDFIDMIEDKGIWNDSLRLTILGIVQELAPKYTKDEEFIENMFGYIEYTQDLDTLITEGFEEIWKVIDGNFMDFYKDVENYLVKNYNI